jgi:hypothetical protein
MHEAVCDVDDNSNVGPTMVQDLRNSREGPNAKKTSD